MAIFNSYVSHYQRVYHVTSFRQPRMTPLAEEHSGAPELSARQGARPADVVGMVRISAVT